MQGDINTPYEEEDTGLADGAASTRLGGPKMLEWELSLAGNDVVSHAWYHGAMSRNEAERQLTSDREFLVRDSASQPDNYVLSCRNGTQPLHFVIQKVVLNPETVYERFQYRFEEEAYDTVADLITSYVGFSKPISAASGARIQFPVNRTTAIYGSRGEADGATATDRSPFVNQMADYSHFTSAHHRRVSHQRTQISVTVPCRYYDPDRKTLSDRRQVLDVGDNSTSGGSWDSSLPASPPAKPARNSNLKIEELGHRLELHHISQLSESDSGNGSGDSALSGAVAEMAKSRQYGSTSTAIKNPPFDYEAAENLLLYQYSERAIETRINLDQFQSVLVSEFPKPLESEVLLRIKMALRTAGPRILASHLTSVDMKFLMDDIQLFDNCAKTMPAIEFAFLPHGRQVRSDIMERMETMKLLIGVTILTSQTDRQRAGMLNDWILLAIETKTALGNLHSFTILMMALCMPQIQCLEKTWIVLRRMHTDNALTFETKLKPCFKSMMDGSYPSPPNTTTPNVLPAVYIFHVLDQEKDETSDPNSSFSHYGMDFDFVDMNNHLEVIRSFAAQVDTFRRNAKTVIQEMSSLGNMLDPALLEMFSTPFQMKFLWGDRCALLHHSERYDRLHNVLTTLAQNPTIP